MDTKPRYPMVKYNPHEALRQLITEPLNRHLIVRLFEGIGIKDFYLLWEDSPKNQKCLYLEEYNLVLNILILYFYYNDFGIDYLGRLVIPSISKLTDYFNQYPDSDSDQIRKLIDTIYNLQLVSFSYDGTTEEININMSDRFVNLIESDPQIDAVKSLVNRISNIIKQMMVESQKEGKMRITKVRVEMSSSVKTHEEIFKLLEILFPGIYCPGTTEAYRNGIYRMIITDKQREDYIKAN